MYGPCELNFCLLLFTSYFTYIIIILVLCIINVFPNDPDRYPWKPISGNVSDNVTFTVSFVILNSESK